jgi:hypothetical protein
MTRETTRAVYEELTTLTTQKAQEKARADPRRFTRNMTMLKRSMSNSTPAKNQVLRHLYEVITIVVIIIIIINLYMLDYQKSRLAAFKWKNAC